MLQPALIAPLVLLATVSAADSAVAQPPEPSHTRPNVLLIMADDFRPEAGCYGSPALTPALDRLAKRSLTFQHAYCQQTVCNPSRSSLLTGKRPDSLRIWNNSVHFRELNPHIQTLPLWFKNHGYHTRCVGKIFHNWHTKVHGDPQSWSAPEFLHFANHGDDRPIVAGPLPPNLAQTTSGFGYAGPGICECRDVPDQAYYDGRVADEAIRTLEEIKSQPFFLAVGFWKPHAQFNAPKKYWDLYDRNKLPPILNTRPENAPNVAFHQSTEILGPAKNQKRPTPEQTAEMRHGYFANISYMDTQLGKVLDALDASGVADRTIVVFLSDHGYHIGEHTLWGKTSTFELDARVPLLIHHPGIAAAGKSTSAIAELIDLFPTLNQLCQLPSPPELDGKSLVTVLQNPDQPRSSVAITQHPRPAYYDRTPTNLPETMGYSIRSPEGRYTEWRDWKSGQITARELYLAADQPAETVNEAANTQHAHTLETLANLLRQIHPPTPHAETPKPPAKP
jgi:iduronate 2-sulfatase